VVRVEFDPTVTSYAQLLEVFFNAHDPTTLNRQGGDEGTQYRSIVLYADEAQKSAAEKSKAAAQASYSDPIMTEIAPADDVSTPRKNTTSIISRRIQRRATAGLSSKPKVAKLQKEGGDHEVGVRRKCTAYKAAAAAAVKLGYTNVKQFCARHQWLEGIPGRPQSRARDAGFLPVGELL